MSNIVDTFVNHHQYMAVHPSGVQYVPSELRFRQMNSAYSASCEQMQYQASSSRLQMNPYVSNMMPFERINTSSPIIQLMPCASEEEDMTNSRNPACDGSKTGKASMKTKLNFNSKAFVVGKSVNKGPTPRKISQDTKSCSDEEGNSTDGSEDFVSSSYYGRKHSAISNLSMPEFEPNGKFVSSDEKVQQEKFKTELCKNWQAGNCKFGTKCSFAHGEDELAEKKHLPSNYKTKICKQFHEEMYCSYGSRCQFIHLQEAPSTQVSDLAKEIYAFAGLRPTRKQKERLPVFKNLTE